MSTAENETLELNMIAPGGPAEAHPTLGHSRHPENNPEGAADARAKIDALHQKEQELTVAAPPAVVPAKLTAPVSPAAQQATAEHATTRKAHRKAVKEHPAKPIFTALASFLLIITLFKAPILYSQISYLFAKPAPTEPVPSLPVTTAASTTPTIMIPKINVNAPVLFEPSIEEAKIQHALQSGVVHYGTSPAPGQAGNSVIVGHSSNDWWEPGNYKFVFVLLDKIVAGDTMTVDYQGTRYIYEVTTTKVVVAEDLSVLAPTSEPSITLITCWPAGTNLKRWIVQSKQISPKVQAAATPSTTTGSGSKQLPGNAPSFVEEIKSFWNSLSGTITNQPTEVEPAPTTSGASATPASSGGVLPGAK